LNTGVNSTADRRPAFVHRYLSFLARQPRDWKVTVVRTSLDRFAYQVVFPYLSVYIMALGATGFQLGLVNSLGMIVAGLCGPYTGWLIDRTGPKKIYLFGIGILSAAYLCYGLAGTWEATIAAMIGYWLGYSTSIHSCATICGNCLANRDRATGMLICETVAAGLLGVAGPMVGAWLVGLSGGVNAEGIRPLFFLAVAFTAGTFVIVRVRLSDSGPLGRIVPSANILADISDMLGSGRNLRKWLVISSISQLPLGMVFPYTQAFAYSVKAADEFMLGAMVTGSALTSIAFAVPLGRLADRIGRKKLLAITIPLFWLSNLVLILAPSPAFLLIAGILQGFYFIGSPITSAIERELVPPERMGRWLGVNRCFKMLVSAAMAVAAGLIWDRIGPQWIFIIFVAVDLLVRIPLLVRMPETLHSSSV
jgi:MFS family permease